MTCRREWLQDAVARLDDAADAASAVLSISLMACNQDGTISWYCLSPVKTSITAMLFPRDADTSGIAEQVRAIGTRIPGGAG